MPGYKNWTTEMLVASDIDDKLQLQTNMVFASEAARDSALGSVLYDGLHCYTQDTNTDWRYNGSAWVAIASAWVSYTPTWNNLTVGDGTVVARRRWENGSIHVRGRFTYGATTSAISGTVSQDLVDGITSDDSGSDGSATYRDVGTQVYSGSTSVDPGATIINFFSPGAGLVSATAPFTWGPTDILTWDIVYKSV